MDRVADAFIWPTRDPQWPTKILIIGLTLLIPIVGGINGLGWMFATLDRLRSGDETLAPANLSYIGRGFGLFVVELVYGLIVVLLTLLVYVPAAILSVKEGSGSANVGLLAAAILLNFVAFGVATIGNLLVTFASPAFVLATYERGIGGGLNLGDLVKRSRLNWTNTLIAGLMLIAAGVVGSLGSILCVVGVVFTAAYALAMQAWIFRSFELGSQAATDERPVKTSS